MGYLELFQVHSLCWYFIPRLKLAPLDRVMSASMEYGGTKYTLLKRSILEEQWLAKLSRSYVLKRLNISVENPLRYGKPIYQVSFN